MTFYEKRYKINAMYLKWLSGYYQDKYPDAYVLSSISRIVLIKTKMDAELSNEKPDWKKYEELANDGMEIINNIEVLLTNFKNNN